MRVNLHSLTTHPGGSLPFEGDLDFSFARLGRDGRFVTPVKIAGVVVMETGVLTLDYSAAFTLSLVCDRCLGVVKRDFSLRFVHTLSLTEPGEDSKAVFCPGGVLDMAELCGDDIFLSLPRQNLCQPDCKGLCPVCGANLNTELCGHECGGSDKTGGDPRWAALRNLNISCEEN